MKTEILSCYDDRILGNPAHMLQEKCILFHWPLPYYEVLNDGLPQDGLYTVSCVVFWHQEIGKLEVYVALVTLSTIHRRGIC